MRYLDLNDCHTKDEVLIYKSTVNIFSKIFLNVLLIIALFFFCYKKDYVMAIASGVFSLYVLYGTIAYYRELPEVQLRINLKGVQYKNDELVIWDNIENERVEIIENDESTEYYFSYYCKNINKAVKLNLEDYSISGNVLISIFKIFRNRKTLQIL